MSVPPVLDSAAKIPHLHDGESRPLEPGVLLLHLCDLRRQLRLYVVGGLLAGEALGNHGADVEVLPDEGTLVDAATPSEEEEEEKWRVGDPTTP